MYSPSKQRTRPIRSMTVNERTHISEVFMEPSPDSTPIPSANTSATSVSTQGNQVSSGTSATSLHSSQSVSSIHIVEYNSSQGNNNNTTPLASLPNSLSHKTTGSTSSGSVGTAITHDSFSSEKSLDSRFIDLARNIMRCEDEGDMKAFLFAYRRFASPTDLYSIFTALYSHLKHGHKSKKTKKDIKSATQFATLWISNYYAVDFARKQVNEMLEQLKDLDPNQQNAIKLQILRGHEMKRTLTSSSPLAHPATLRDRSGSTIMRPSSVGSSNPNSPTTTDISSLSFLNLNPVEVAKALTVMEFEAFSKVFSTEFLIKIGWQNYYPPPGIHHASPTSKLNVPAVTGPVATPGCPNLNYLIQRFNQVSFWVTTEVLTRKGKAQISTMHRFIEIAQKCYEFNNYNSMMEILSGLNNGAILRLKRLWASLSDRRLRVFEHLEEVMSAQQNFKNYYHEINEKQLPVLPYIALFLREFTFMYQGNSVFGADDNINFDLFRQLFERAKFVQKFQAVAYKLPTDPAIMNFLNHLHYIEDDDILYQMSINTQPSMWLLDHNKHGSDFSDSSSGARTHRDSEKKPNRDYSLFDKNSQRSDITGSDSETDDDISVSGSETSELSSVSGHDTDSAKHHRHRRAASVGGVSRDKDLTDSAATTSYHSNDTDSDPGRDTPLLSGKGGQTSGPSSASATPAPSFAEGSMSPKGSVTPQTQTVKLRANSEDFPNFPHLQAATRNRSSTIDKMFLMTNQIQAMHENISFGQDNTVSANTRIEDEEVVEQTVPANQHIDVPVPAPTPVDLLTPKPGVSESTSVQEPSSLLSSRASSVPSTAAPSTHNSPRVSRQPSSRRRKTKKRSFNHCVTVKVPSEYNQVFANAERIIDKYFADCRHSHEKGIYEISDQRYILIRAGSVSHEFWEAFKAEVPPPNSTRLRTERSDSNPNLSEFTQNFLFDMAHSIGKTDYRYFATELPAKNEMDLLATGFINVAFSGWGSMQIHEESMFTRDESFKLIFDVAHSCEAHTFEQNGTKSTHPVCVLLCGYTSGWCSELFGISLTCTELSCTAKGDAACKFLMASPNRIDEYISECIQELNLSQENSQVISVPTYLETRKERKYSLTKATPPPLTSSIDLAPPTPMRLEPKTAKLNTSSDNVRNVANVLYKGNQEQIVASKRMTKRSEKLFHSMQCDPEHATINFAEREDQRFLFIRGKSIGQEFVNLIKNTLRNDDMTNQFARQFLNDFGRYMAKADSQYLKNSFETTNSVERVYLLPVMLQKLGWGKGEVCLGSKLKANDEFYLKTQVQHSFEGESYFLANNPKQLKRTPSFTLRSGTPPGNLNLPVCHLHCGYSAGFASHTFDMNLVTMEVSCIALNHSCCTFITAPPSTIFTHVKSYLAEHNRPQEWPAYSIAIQTMLGMIQSNDANQPASSNNNNSNSPSTLRHSAESAPGFFARLRKSLKSKEKD